MISDELRTLIGRVSGQDLLMVDEARTLEIVGKEATLDAVMYVQYCLTPEGYGASGIGMLGYESLREYTLTSHWSIIHPFGLYIIASDVCGNAVVVDCRSGHVYYAHHESFCEAEDPIFCPPSRQDYKNPAAWHYVHGYSRENVLRGMLPLETDLGRFLKQCLEGLLEEELFELG